MIRLNDLHRYIIEKNNNHNYVRHQALHLSEVAICGYKYRYILDNNITYPFTYKYEIGNAFEKIMVSHLNELTPVASQYEVEYNAYNYTFVGHLDAYDYKNNVIYELKSSTSAKDFTDIYLRQLKAYMIVLKADGLLWKYNILSGQFDEIEVHYDELSKEDFKSLDDNIKAFTENRYVEGIENSLCYFCNNVNCPMRVNK